MTEQEQMAVNIKRQLESPNVKKGTIKRSTIWNTVQGIRTIQRQLVEGYAFDKEHLSALVSAMFGFINGVVDPSTKVKGMDEKIEEIGE